VLALLGCFAALVLAVTLYSLTREQDPDIAMLALTCRVAEGVISAISIPETLGLLWLATATGANAPDTAAAHALGAYLLRGDMALSGSFFALGSMLFCYLLLRGRMIPGVLAWLGAPAGGGPSIAARRLPGRPNHLAHLVADACVRGGVRPLAAHQGCGHAPEESVRRPAVLTVSRPALVTDGLG